MTRTYTTVDRSAWGSGPWQDEPDKIVWTDGATGRPCMIKRGPMGALCGYVAVDPGHPWHGREYSDCALAEPCEGSYCEHAIDGTVRAHGGLTYSDRSNGDEESGICHVPEPGQPHDVWWFGFDCAHCDDLRPRAEARFRYRDEVYRDVEYVRAQVLGLARQLTKVTP